MTTRFGGPLLHARKNSGAREQFSDCPIAVDTDYFVFEDDFINYDAGTAGPWTEIKDTSAVAAVLTDAPYGVLNLSGTASDDTGASIQLTEEVFTAQSGKELWLFSRFMLEDADQTDVYIGFTVNFATNPEAALTAADRIGFQINDGDASILCKTERSGTETSTDSAVDATDYTTATDPDDAAWVEVAIHVRNTNDSGAGEAMFFINGSKVATHTTNIPDDEYLSVAAFSLNGEATQNSLLVDYIKVVQKR